MTRNLFQFLIIGTLLFGCANASGEAELADDTEAVEPGKEKWETTESGLQYKVDQKNKKGTQAQAGHLVSVHYTGTLEDGTKFDSSRDRGEPIMFVLGKGRVIKGWDEGIALMKTGERFTLKIPGNLAYGERGQPQANIPPNATLMFDVELMEVISQPFPIAEGTEPEVTATGLKIYRYNTTEGATPQAGQNVFVHYTGYLPDGTVFDSSWNKGRPFGFPLGGGRVIKGWDEGIALLKSGERAKLVIPSELAYDPAGGGNGLIPPNTELTFDVILVGIQ